MANKQAVEYARDLANRGFTEDAARSFLLSRGFTLKDTDEAMIIASKPKKEKSINASLIVALAAIILLIPILFVLVGNSSSIDSNLEDNSYIPQAQNNYIEDQKLKEEFSYSCSSNEECLLNEDCLNNKCSPLYCSSCEEILDHQCIPLICNDNQTNTLDYCTDGTCFNEQITSCLNEDNFCPEGCNETTDLDCSSQLECISNLDCGDDNPETIDSCISPFEGAQKECVHSFPLCVNSDGYCPLNCTAITDDDCEPICGNDIKEDPEECDGDCPLAFSDCNDNNTCTTNTLLGSSALCTAECVYSEITMCLSNDGCCPSVCTYSSDNDCPPSSISLATGSFTSVQRITSGNIELLSYESGIHKIIFDQFSITNTNLDPNLKVYLAVKQTVRTKEDLDAGNLLLEPLIAISGEQEYEILGYIFNIQDYNSVVIFQDNLNAVYSYSTINYI